MTERLIAKGVSTQRIREISNWATGDLTVVRGPLNELANDWGLGGKFVLLYSGNLGIAHDHETIIRAVALARKSVPEVRLLFIGRGARLGDAQLLVQHLGLGEVVQFRPAVSSNLVPHTLGIANLGLVTILPGFDGLVVPSKLLGHMARGVPSLYVGPADSDVAQILAKSGGGISFGNGKIVDVAGAITKLASDPAAIDAMGMNAKSYYEQFFARDIGLSLYRVMLRSVIGDPPDDV